MNYEIVYLKEKTVVGVSSRACNDDPEIPKIIGGLWNKLYQGGINEKIKNKANEYAIGLYSDYGKNDYLVTAGNEVTNNENPELTAKIIPAGMYAKFSIEGHMEHAVAEAWGKIWKMNLDRNYKADFEEYLTSDYDNAKIDIYISLK